jgi:hypothetical protein
MEKLERYKIPSIGHIPAERIQAGGNISHSEIHILINLIWNKKKTPTEVEGI